MTLTTLMVQLQLSKPSPALLRIVGDIAERHHAGVIGIAAAPPIHAHIEDYVIIGDLVQQYQDSVQKQIDNAEAAFRTALQDRVSDLEWRSAKMISLTRYLASEARSADVVVTGIDRHDWGLDHRRNAYAAEIVLGAGRPVLIVPTWVEHGNFDHVVISWKDSSESRRAVAGALPILKLASHVAVVEVTQAEELPASRTRLNDVAAWLKKHGIMAETVAYPSNGDDAARLVAFTKEQHADLIISGAYGHNRSYERAFGAVTRNLLFHAERCALVSH